MPVFAWIAVPLLVLLGFVAASGPQLLWSGEPPAPVNFWHDAPPEQVPDQLQPQRKPWILRERPIAFDPQLLTILKDAGARPHPPVTLEFFDGVRYLLDVTSTLSKFNDTAVLRGTLKSALRTDWTFVITGSVVAGTVQYGERLFKVEHVANGRHRLLEVDPAKLSAE